MLGLQVCGRAFSSCGKWGPLFIAVHGPLTIVASLVAEHRLQTRRLSNLAHGPSCSAACGIFPDQGSNPCPLHWQADSQPLRHQGSPQPFSWINAPWITAVLLVISRAMKKTILTFFCQFFHSFCEGENSPRSVHWKFCWCPTINILIICYIAFYCLIYHSFNKCLLIT